MANLGAQPSVSISYFTSDLIGRKCHLDMQCDCMRHSEAGHDVLPGPPEFQHVRIPPWDAHMSALQLDFDTHGLELIEQPANGFSHLLRHRLLFDLTPCALLCGLDF